MITSLKAKLRKAEYERGVYKQQLDVAEQKLRDGPNADSNPGCECEALKGELCELKKENHSLKTKVGMLTKPAKPKTPKKTKKATAKK